MPDLDRVVGERDLGGCRKFQLGLGTEGLAHLALAALGGDFVPVLAAASKGGQEAKDHGHTPELDRRAHS